MRYFHLIICCISILYISACRFPPPPVPASPPPLSHHIKCENNFEFVAILFGRPTGVSLRFDNLKIPLSYDDSTGIFQNNIVFKFTGKDSAKIEIGEKEYKHCKFNPDEVKPI